MICLTTFAIANPRNGRILSSRGSSRLAYLINYLMYQQRKATSKTDAEWRKQREAKRRTANQENKRKAPRFGVSMDDVLPTSEEHKKQLLILLAH